MPEWVRLSEGLCVRLILLDRDSRPEDGKRLRFPSGWTRRAKPKRAQTSLAKRSGVALPLQRVQETGQDEYGSGTRHRGGVRGDVREKPWRSIAFPLTYNVRAKPGPMVGRQGPDADNVPRTCGRALVARRWASA